MNTQEEIFTFNNVWEWGLRGTVFWQIPEGVIYCSHCGIDSVIRARIVNSGIDSQPGGSVQQHYLSYWPASLHRLTESIHGLLKRFQIRAGPALRLLSFPATTWAGWPVDAGQGLTATLTGNRRLPAVPCWQLTACRLLLSLSMSCWRVKSGIRDLWHVTIVTVGYDVTDV